MQRCPGGQKRSSGQVGPGMGPLSGRSLSGAAPSGAPLSPPSATGVSIDETSSRGTSIDGASDASGAVAPSGVVVGVSLHAATSAIEAVRQNV
jgi:hypothetical protein